MYIETHSTVEDGVIVELRKLKIEGKEAELRAFALAVLDAIDSGKVKRQVEAAKIIIKLTP